VKVCNESDWFKPEYIFPQFFMEYILDKGDEKRIIGIKYASVKTTTKHQYERDEWELYTCYVVPAISIHDKAIEGDDSMELFGIENTISAVEQELLSYGLSSTNGGAIEIERKKNKDKMIITESDLAISYESTRFFEVEFFLTQKWNQYDIA